MPLGTQLAAHDADPNKVLQPCLFSLVDNSMFRFHHAESRSSRKKPNCLGSILGISIMVSFVSPVTCNRAWGPSNKTSSMLVNMN